MKKLSATPFFYKRLFPFMVLFPVAAIFFVSAGTGSHSKVPPPPPLFIAVWLFICVAIFLTFRKLVAGLVDEVYDCGDSLLIKNGGQSEQIQLAEIRNVSTNEFANPPRVVLSLRTPGRFGKEIVFIPARQNQMAAFLRKKNPEIENLIDRIDDAKRIPANR